LTDVIEAGSLEENRLAQRRDRLLTDVIEADSLIDLLIEEIDFELVIEAGSLVARELIDESIH